MIGKHFTESLNKVELGINRVRINRAGPVVVNNVEKRTKCRNKMYQHSARQLKQQFYCWK